VSLDKIGLRVGECSGRRGNAERGAPESGVEPVLGRDAAAEAVDEHFAAGRRVGDPAERCGGASGSGIEREPGWARGLTVIAEASGFAWGVGVSEGPPRVGEDRVRERDGWRMETVPFREIYWAIISRPCARPAVHRVRPLISPMRP
jgi:hypothetical protein